jgi:SAM-dependent methyltransferase
MSATDYTETYDPDTDFDRWYTLGTAAAIARSVKSRDHVLELGCATGLMTATLVDAGAVVTGVDRSDGYLERARCRCLPRATFIRADVRFFDIGSPVDHVVATNLIHELPDPAAFLQHCRTQLRIGGLLHLALQNPSSIHRLTALELGLITELHEISGRGHQYGTLRLFDADELEALGRAAGFTLVSRGGVMLKPLPNALMEALPDQVLQGFLMVAHRFPEHCAVNYLVMQT